MKRRHQGWPPNSHRYAADRQARRIETAIAEQERRPNLSADIYSDNTGKEWSASISEHPPQGGDGKVVWEKHGMSSEHNATTAMEAAHQRLSRSLVDKCDCQAPDADMVVAAKSAPADD